MLTSIKGNGLEGYINGECVCPGQFLPLTSTEASTSTGSKSGEVNPEYDAWMKTDQQLLSWHMSTIQKNLLSTMIHCATAEELWRSLTSMFISQTQAKLMPLRTQIQTLKKG